MDEGSRRITVDDPFVAAVTPVLGDRVVVEDGADVTTAGAHRGDEIVGQFGLERPDATTHSLVIDEDELTDIGPGLASGTT